MSKRSKVKSSHTSLRLAPDVAGKLTDACERTGWSNARVVGHLVKVGFAAAAKEYGSLNDLIAAYHGAISLHAVELDNAKRLADARAAVRAVVAAPHVKALRKAIAKPRTAKPAPPVAAARPGSAA
jgi:hypothetical protein